MSFSLSPFTLPRAAPAAKKGGSLPPLPPPPVRRHDAPCEAGTPWRAAAVGFTPDELGESVPTRVPCGFPGTARTTTARACAL